MKSRYYPVTAAYLALTLLVTAPFAAKAMADDDSSSGTSNAQVKQKTNTTGSTDEVTNNRMKTEEGSRSRFSGQFNLTYNGGALSSPFSDTAPNPNGTVPPPLVTLSGTVSARYRIDQHTTAGVGTGITTQTPFQGPKNTTVADPYIDVAHSFKTGPIQHRTDVQATFWTNDQYRNELGYRVGLTALNEAYYEWSFGLTTGFLVEVDWNAFSNAAEYTATVDQLANRTTYDLATDPYFEYQLTKRINLRSVIGINFFHTGLNDGFLDFYNPSVYQSLGVGIQVADAVFLYPFLEAAPYSGHMTANSTLVGMNAIINLF